MSPEILKYDSKECANFDANLGNQALKYLNCLHKLCYLYITVCMCVSQFQISCPNLSNHLGAHLSFQPIEVSHNKDKFSTACGHSPLQHSGKQRHGNLQRTN